MQKQCVKPKGLLHRRCFWILGVIILWWLICIYHFSSSNPNQFSQGLSFFQSSSTQVLHSSFELPPTRSLSRAASSFQNLHNHQSRDRIDNTNACDGKYIYIHHLPKMFHEDLLANCSQPTPWKDICKVSSNGGLGPKLQVNKDNVFPRDGWFATNQFALELIFHNRMKQYKCLTEDSSKAALVYVPFYAGLDISRNLWGANVSVRDELPNALANWLERQEEWRVMGGRDHFMVCGRMTWDFRRLTDAENDWGNKLLLLDVVQNMSTLLIEKSPWHYNDYAIPYPTYFHPYKHSDVIEWQDRVRLHPRPSLFSFAGAPREEMEESIRGQVMEQCRGSRLCTLLECDKGESKCHSPLILMSLFQESVFCLQPQGDSATRRSIFDSMVAGCIPVFFHPHSAYIQYIWHLPQNHSDYSVFIPQDDIKHNLANIERILKSIPPHHVAHMREQVISLIPRLIYANPTSTSLLPDFEDAFDVAVQGLIDKVAEVRIKERQNGVMSMLFASM